ncbi:MAG: heme o synthase, partial [Pseudomonadota bacterium]
MSLMDAGAPTTAAADAEVRDYWALLNPRVMSRVIFTALVGLLAAPIAPHPLVAFAGLLCVAVGAGASGALNMWWDADIDAVMERTRKRPVPAGRVEADEALWFGLGLSVLSVALLTIFAGPVAGGLLAATIAFYVVVYTMWLKRTTPQNIVIGGLAGATPPMIGWAIATGGISVEPLILTLVIFLWTPPHSWALALFRRNDYAAVGVPMLPVSAGEAETRRQILIYALALAPAALAPAATAIGGPVYLAAAGLATARWVQLALRLRRRGA